MKCTIAWCIRDRREPSSAFCVECGAEYDRSDAQFKTDGYDDWIAKRNARGAEPTEQLIARLTAERDAARAQVTELQARSTAQALELRAVDRRRMVREFFTVAGQAIGERPHVPDEKTVRFRLRIVAEEFVELLEAVFAEWRPEQFEVIRASILFIIDTAPIRVDMPNAIDATVDLDYVVEGLRLAFGVDSAPVWAEVQRANLAKFGGPKRESDGKQLKPEGWRPPDIAGELERQGWRR